MSATSEKFEDLKAKLIKSEKEFDVCIKAKREERQKREALEAEVSSIRHMWQSDVKTLTDQNEKLKAERDDMAKKLKLIEATVIDCLETAIGQVQVESLAGNIVKEEFWKGEISALRQIKELTKGASAR